MEYNGIHAYVQKLRHVLVIIHFFLLIGDVDIDEIGVLHRSVSCKQ